MLDRSAKNSVVGSRPVGWRGWWSSVLLVGLIVALVAPAAARGGSIEGYVLEARADGTGPRLAGVEVRLVEGTQSAVTAADGTYRIEGIPEGYYHVIISPPPAGYVGQVFGNVPCFAPGTYAGCPVDLGSFLEVPAEGTIENVIFPLQPEAVITGDVTEASEGSPADAKVALYLLSDPIFEPSFVRMAQTVADGSFRFDGLPEAVYYAVASGPGFFGELWREKPCPANCDVAAGDQIFVRSGEVTGGVEFTLALESTITGRVTEEGSGDPLSFFIVWLFDSAGTFLDAATTDDDGVYAFDLLGAGTYYLRTFAAVQWADEIYDGFACPGLDGSCDVTTGTPVVLAPGAQATGVDFSVAVGGQIHGTVRSEIGQPVAAVVDAWSATGERLRTAYAATDGTYQLTGFQTGDYFITTRLAQGYLPQLYQGLPCGELPEPDCDVTLGTPVHVELGQTTDGIDFALESSADCTPGDFRACLNRGRFAVDITWTRPDGTSGKAHSEQLPGIDDSGYFWFFRPDNVELFVKVLDACNTTFNNYWVFAAGLTNVEVQIRVKDTVTGFEHTYGNPQSRPFQPIQDTATFRVCP
ncbi:MAG: carboxypeptidase regulatory-like domain-containing protein [Acidobacteria bacterium]|nr:carboxypeptidase regulatory-like domain-containing protein [Acidobacteriota bacterium]